MSSQGGDITYYYKFHAGACDGDIHASQVIEEAYLSLLVGTHKGYYYYVALLSLETVNGVHCDEPAVWFVELATLN